MNAVEANLLNFHDFHQNVAYCSVISHQVLWHNFGDLAFMNDHLDDVDEGMQMMKCACECPKVAAGSPCKDPEGPGPVIRVVFNQFGRLLFFLIRLNF